MFICDISVFNRYGKQKLDEQLEVLKLKWHDLVLILVVDEVPGIEQTRLIPYLQTDKANVTKLIQRLEQCDYLYREINKEDKRNKNVFLTNQGKFLVPKLYEIMNIWEDACFSDIEKSELEIYKKISSKIIDNIVRNTNE
jgi:DNA-binding MarR family transcriptional regulator